MKDEIVYFDKDNNITDLEHAKTAIIRELDENGNLIREIYGNIGDEEEEELEDDSDVVIKRS